MNHNCEDDENDKDHENRKDYKNHKGHENRKDHEEHDEHHKDHKEQKDHEDQKQHEDHGEGEGREEPETLNRGKDSSIVSAMDPIPAETERIVREVIGAAIAVHRALGPGFIEAVYDRALCVELGCRHLMYESQKCIDISYRGQTIYHHKLDLVVVGVVIVEVKAVKKIRPIHQAQVLSYLKASRRRVALLMNFNVKLFVHGLHRFAR